MLSSSFFIYWTLKLAASNLHTKFGKHFVNMKTAVEMLFYSLSLSPRHQKQQSCR